MIALSKTILAFCATSNIAALRMEKSDSGTTKSAILERLKMNPMTFVNKGHEYYKWQQNLRGNFESFLDDYLESAMAQKKQRAKGLLTVGQVKQNEIQAEYSYALLDMVVTYSVFLHLTRKMADLKQAKSRAERQLDKKELQERWDRYDKKVEQLGYTRMALQDKVKYLKNQLECQAMKLKTQAKQCEDQDSTAADTSSEGSRKYELGQWYHRAYKSSGGQEVSTYGYVSNLAGKFPEITWLLQTKDGPAWRPHSLDYSTLTMKLVDLESDSFQRGDMQIYFRRFQLEIGWEVAAALQEKISAVREAKEWEDLLMKEKERVFKGFGCSQLCKKAARKAAENICRIAQKIRTHRKELGSPDDADMKVARIAYHRDLSESDCYVSLFDKQRHLFSFSDLLTFKRKARAEARTVLRLANLMRFSYLHSTRRWPEFDDFEEKDYDRLAKQEYDFHLYGRKPSFPSPLGQVKMNQLYDQAKEYGIKAEIKQMLLEERKLAKYSEKVDERMEKMAEIVYKESRKGVPAWMREVNEACYEWYGFETDMPEEEIFSSNIARGWAEHIYNVARKRVTKP